MNNNKTTPLHLHTLESLCNELVSGRPIYLEDGSQFLFDSPETRSIFNWYLQHENKWASQNKKDDVEKIVDQLKEPPPEKPSAEIGPRKEKRCLHLKQMRVHRFAGIHAYGEIEQAPDDFEYCFEKPVTLIEGKNGSGKTSLLNAIVWCLTGHIYRSQREPERIKDGIDITVESDSGIENSINKNATAITPIPSDTILKSLGDKHLPLDTWVELNFVDDQGKDAGTIKRSLERTSKGKIQVNTSGSLGLVPIALEIGTRMPGLIPYIQLDAVSDLGKAIAALTGLKPLEDLVKHAEKSQDKLKGELRGGRKAEINSLDDDFTQIRSELEILIKNNPNISPEIPLPSPGPDKTIEKKLEDLSKHFEELQAKAFEDSKRILGETFDPKIQETRNDLIDNVGKALGLLDPSNLIRLPSATVLGNLKVLEEEKLQGVETLIQKLLSEAEEIEKLAQKPDHAARRRLYARVATWLKEHEHLLENCPICLKFLGDQTDDVTGEKITKHLEEYVKSDKDYLANTIEAWGNSCDKILADKIPSALCGKDLPSAPTDLIAKAFGEELFNSNVFKYSLAPLREVARNLCVNVLASLQDYEEPKQPSFSEDLLGKCSKFCGSIKCIKRAVAFARWRQINAKECTDAFYKIIGKEDGDGQNKDKEKIAVADMSLLECLTTLDEMVKNTTPVTEALLKIKAMSEKIKRRREKENRIELYGQAATAIEDLLKLKKLVNFQVAALMEKLSGDTKKWKNKLYQPGCVGVPELAGTNVGTDGALGIDAKIGGTTTSARHISNASDLRATLLAILIAFWNYLIKERGGLSFILLDDLQELFDKPNRYRVANTIPEIVKKGGRVIATTNDHVFGRQITSSCIKEISCDKIDRRQIHPLKPYRPHIELGNFIEAIEAKRQEFEKIENQNKGQPVRDYINEDQTARDYIKDLRIYIENRLLDFFDSIHPGLPLKPTFSDLVDAIRTRRSAGQEPFGNQAFDKMLRHPAFQNGSVFSNLMNESHHGNENQIMYADVSRIKDDCMQARKLIDHAHEDYERWLQRDAPEPVPDKPDMPEPVETLKFEVPFYKDLAAATSDSGLSEIPDATEKFSDKNWIENYAVYVINTDNFGFSGTRNCRAIVKLSDEPVPDNSLVIALHKDKIYARRLLRCDHNPGMIALGSEASNPLKRTPSLLLPIEEVQLLEVAGILFDNNPHWTKQSGEAALITNYVIPDKVELAFEIRGNSALPLAIPGQKVLAGHSILPDQLKNNKGCFVAIVISGNEAFKRIGDAVPGVQGLRVFESIGGLGESILVHTEELENNSFIDLPLLQSTRKVIGVLYDG